jgi:arylsulfatase A-like enzyme
MPAPNVLFIVVDDLRPQLNCYGRAHMVTPQIDRLAQSGTLFERPYCQVPVCGATRASLLTGLRPARHRFIEFDTWADRDAPGTLTLPQHFREHGYITLSDGKVFHHWPDCAERSWSEPPWMPPPGPDHSWRNYLLDASRARAAENNGAGPPYECADVPDNAYFDGQTTDRAIADLQRLARMEQPFFLAVGLLKPHLPFNAPRCYWELYNHDEISLADNPFAPEGAPPQALHNFGELRAYFDVPREGPVPDDLARMLVHGYYAATSYTDAQVGRLLATLDELGLHENTIVVLWGDHGWQLGEHSLWCKHCNFNTSLCAPLIVRAPDVKPGQRTQGLVEFLDVYPTLADLCGLPIPGHCAGASFVPLLSDPGRPGKPAVFSRYIKGDSVRTDRYLYTEWTEDDGTVTGRMLYDHGTDPDENVSLAGNPEHADTVKELSALLPRGE